MDPTTGHQYQKPNIKGVTKAVLVTGGAGYVGSHTCKLLAKNGYVPITIDRHFREGLKTFGPCHDLHLPQEVDRLDEIIKRYPNQKKLFLNIILFGLWLITISFDFIS